MGNNNSRAPLCSQTVIPDGIFPPVLIRMQETFKKERKKTTFFSDFTLQQRLFFSGQHL